MNNTSTDSVTNYLQNHSGILCFSLNREGVVVDTNRFARDFIGAEVKGRRFDELLVDFAGRFSLSEAVRDPDEAWQLTIASGRGWPHSFHTHFYDNDDTIEAFAESDQRYDALLQENLIQMNTEFSNLSRELQKKTAELEKLNELKNRFIGTAAHDLRNPIGAIRNLAEVLLEDISGSLDPEHAEILTMIGTASGSVLTLLDDLLTIARIESGKLELKLEPHDIVEFARESIRMNRIFATKRDVTVRLERFEEIPSVLFDRSKIEQVMNNLLSNAIKYSPSGGVVVVSVFRSGDHVTVSVCDEGPGIPKEEQGRLFKPFSRTSVPVPTGESSTGLGLAIARNIIIGHLGEIGIADSTGTGSEFYFSLPLNRTGDGLTPDPQ
ncbi:MAG: sensor histidine kinase [Alkalispirochaeta sp.]